jgi:hypothetical protein
MTARTFASGIELPSFEVSSADRFMKGKIKLENPVGATLRRAA